MASSSQQPSSQTRDPFQLLREQHDVFRALLARWPGATEASTRRSIILDLNGAIASHASIGALAGGGATARSRGNCVTCTWHHVVAPSWHPPAAEEQYVHELYKKYLSKDLGERYFAESLEADEEIRQVRAGSPRLRHPPLALVQSFVIG
jgi:hypothetical protein